MENLIPVAYAQQAGSGAGQHSVRSAYSFEETLTRLKAAIAAADLWLIHEIDPQALVRKGGYAIGPTRQLLYFHPRYLVRLLAQDSAAIVEAPLKLVVMEMPPGQVVVRSPDLNARWAQYNGVQELGQELALLSRQLLDAVATPAP